MRNITVGCLCALLFLVACVEGPSGEDLTAVPDFALTYPEARQVGASAIDPNWTPEGQEHARAERRLVAEATRDEVFSFYDEALQEQGWAQGSGFFHGRCGGYTDHHWYKGDLTLGLGWVEEHDILDTGCGGITMDEVLSESTTAFELVIGYRPKAGPRPSYAPPTPGPTTISDVLWDRPERSLALPDSVIISDGAGWASEASDGAASVWVRFGTNASMTEVISFYEDELAARGWATGVGSRLVLDKYHREACGWHLDGLGFLLTEWDPVQWRDIHPTGREWLTVYDLVIIERISGSDRTACLPAR